MSTKLYEKDVQIAIVNAAKDVIVTGKGWEAKTHEEYIRSTIMAFAIGLHEAIHEVETRQNKGT